MEKTCKEIRSRVYFLTDKANRLSKNEDKGLDVRVKSQRDERVSKYNCNNDGEFSPEQIDRACIIKGIKEVTTERIEWTSGDISVTCVVWCKGFPFYHLVTCVSGIRVVVIWG